MTILTTADRNLLGCAAYTLAIVATEALVAGIIAVDAGIWAVARVLDATGMQPPPHRRPHHDRRQKIA